MRNCLWIVLIAPLAAFSIWLYLSVLIVLCMVITFNRLVSASTLCDRIINEETREY